MNKDFRNKLLSNNTDLNDIFNTLLINNEIREIDSFIISLINKDKTPIKVNNEVYALKDLFREGYTLGMCQKCAFELVLLLDKFGIYSEAVKCINKYFEGTKGSFNGGHWYVEVTINNKKECIDTSLLIMGSPLAFTKLGHQIERKYDIDSLFKEYSELIDYYDNMIIKEY